MLCIACIPAFLFFSLSYFLFHPSLSLSLPPSPSPAVYLLTLTVWPVNNWWFSLTQRVAGPGENVSLISLFIYTPIFKLSRSVKLPQASLGIDSAKQRGAPDRVHLTVSGGGCTRDHERVNAACLADSRTEAGKGSLNEWMAGGRGGGRGVTEW